MLGVHDVYGNCNSNFAKRYGLVNEFVKRLVRVKRNLRLTNKLNLNKSNSSKS